MMPANAQFTCRSSQKEIMILSNKNSNKDHEKCMPRSCFYTPENGRYLVLGYVGKIPRHDHARLTLASERKDEASY